MLNIRPIMQTFLDYSLAPALLSSFFGGDACLFFLGLGV